MSNTPSGGRSAGVSPEEMTSALFAHLVMQQSNMAMMLLGKVPHPETGQPMRDIEGARMFIDHLEMLETKTKGNLTKEEQSLLKQTLYGLRMAFVEAVDSVETKSPGDHGAAIKTPLETGPEKKEGDTETPSPEESHKRFSKKY